jgi:hypothetical protein
MQVKRHIAPKLVELILYVTQRCAGDPDFGVAKLGKLLYFSDFLAYGRLGASITGGEYTHQPEGPAPGDIAPVLDDMVQRGDLTINVAESVFCERREQLTNLRTADTRLFAENEIRLVDEVIDSLETLSANEIGWRATCDGQTIPYSTVFLSNRPLTQTEQFRGRQLMHQIEQSGRLPASLQRLRNAS